MRSARLPKVRSLVAASSVVLASVVIPVLAAQPAAAAPVGVQQRTAETATDDILPTVQTDGVVWSTVAVGNTIYATGSFTVAKSAASDPVQTTTPRSNLLAFDVVTGKLIDSFNVPLNAQGMTLAKSPDGSRIYVGGDFTTVGGFAHSRIAAINTATGQVDNNFKGKTNARVAAIAATNTTVFVGGSLSTANNIARSRLAAFNASDGALLAWAPSADLSPKTMVMTPDGSKVVIGGQFQKLNGVDVYGLGALSPVDGSLVPYGVSGQVRAYGNNAGITALRSDGTAIYGTGYAFGGLPISGLHEFEGTFSADANTGNLIWMEDCHGDSYDVYSTGTVVYSVSHAHRCLTVGAFPQTALGENRRALAFSAAATGTLNTNTTSGYKNWGGSPAPTMYNWFPDLKAGTFTGQDQAAWTATGVGPYVVMGGEFPTVNGVTQYGLVRFATRPTAPGLDGPRAQGSNLTPTVISVKQGTARVSWQANWDRDDKDLTYTVYRRVTGQPANTQVLVNTQSFGSMEWFRPTLSFIDTGLSDGESYSYRVYTTDGDGNQVQGDLATVVAASAPSGYAQAVAADNPSLEYRLGEPSGTTVYDYAGLNDATAAAGVTRGVAGAIAGDSDLASQFSGGSTGFAASGSTSVTAAGAFTLEAWFKTTSSSGGTILNFGNKATGTSGTTDRVLYLDNAGHVLFGVNNGSARTVASANTYRDGTWHHVAATLGADGMELYVDGYRVANRPDAISASTLAGFWRVGGDSLTGWTSKPNSNFLNGSIDEVAVYPSQLSPQKVAAHAVAGGKTVNLPVAPADAYGAAIFNDDPELYWRLANTSGSALADSSPNNSNPGTLNGINTLNQAGAITANSNPAIKFNGLNGFGYSQKSVINPGTFSVESWFKTTTNTGGRIIGFGNNQTSNSSQADRQVYMANNGRLVFAVGSSATITSPAAYNDGNWHHVTATYSSATGMRLYVDGQQVVTGGSTTPLSITGYWRVGGDTTSGGLANRFLNGTIDEAAVYYTVLDAAKVLNHYQVGTDTTPNTPPVAAFTSEATNLQVAFDGSTSADPDGTIASYSWNWGDGTPAGSGANPTHAFGATGTYSVTLTVTDNRGGTNAVSHEVSVLAANVLPTAAFTPTVDHLGLSVDGSASTDPDGTIASYSWNWGDGTAAGSGATASHNYATADTFTVTLTVTDNRGGTATVSHDVTTTLVPNNPPVPAFSSSAVARTVSVNGSGTTDSDGTIASYSWNWGDGTAAGSGVTASHPYAADGTYTITLTATDDDGDTATISHDVTVSGVAAADAFARTVANGWGSADTGGAWTLTGGNTKFNVNGSTAQILMSAAGSGPTANLNSLSLRDVDGVVDFTVDKPATGGGVYTTISTRKVGTSSYTFTTKFIAGGGVTVSIAKIDNGTSTSLGTATVAGLTFAVGDVIRTRFQSIGTGTTNLAIKAWKVGSAEPAAFQLIRTDTTASIQGAGAFGVQAYLSGSSTNAPVTASFDNVSLSAG